MLSRTEIERVAGEIARDAGRLYEVLSAAQHRHVWRWSAKNTMPPPAPPADAACECGAKYGDHIG